MDNNATAAAEAALAQLLETAEEAYPGITGERYLSAFALTALLYEWFLTLANEKRFIWRKPVTSGKVIFVILRYLVMACQLMMAYALSGLSLENHLSDAFCRGMVILVFTASLTTLGLADYIMISWVYTLWDHRRKVQRMLLAGFIASYALAFAMCIVNFPKMLKSLTYDGEIFHICLIEKTTKAWIGIWASQIAFDVFVVVLTVANAASRPRSVDVQLIADLRRDGGVFFFLILSFRLINLVLCTLNNTSYKILGFCFVWSMTTITVTRLILRIEHLRLPRHKRRRTNFDETIPEEHEMPAIYVVPSQASGVSRASRDELPRSHRPSIDII